MGYKMDMNNESNTNILLDEGWHDFLITNCEEKQSKKGNDMFVVTAVDDVSKKNLKVFCTAVPGSRWFLKQLLTAAGIKAGQDGIYEWDIPDLINKTVSARIEQIDEKWIDRDGNEKTTKKDKIVEWQSLDDSPFK